MRGVRKWIEDTHLHAVERGIGEASAKSKLKFRERESVRKTVDRDGVCI